MLIQFLRLRSLFDSSVNSGYKYLMRLIMVWGDDHPGTENLFKTLEKNGHEVAYWVGLEGARHFGPSDAIFQEHFTAWDGKPAKGYEKWMVPPSMSSIEEHYQLESRTLTMMNKRFDSLCVDERKHTYYQILGYWSKVLDEIKPDAVLCPSLPHGIYNFMLWELARERGIYTICYEEVWYLQRCIEFSDFWKGSEALRSALRKNLEKGISFEDLSKESQVYLIEQRQKITAPAYMEVQRGYGEGWGLVRHRARVFLRSLRSGNTIPLAWHFLRRRMKRDLRDEYRELSKTPDLSKPFVYFPLATQPERTTSPQGDIFHDQMLALQMLSRALPEGWVIYAKEHPSQWWIRTKTRYNCVRYPGYYRELSSIPNVSLIPADTPNAGLIAASKVISTITGTPGWEAILRGKAPIIFGIPWYRDCPGVLHVSSAEECKDAFDRIQRGHGIKESDLYAYIRALEETTVDAYIEEHKGDTTSMRKTIPESIRSLAEGMCVSLNRYSSGV